MKTNLFILTKHINKSEIFLKKSIELRNRLFVKNFKALEFYAILYELSLNLRTDLFINNLQLYFIQICESGQNMCGPLTRSERTVDRQRLEFR